MNKKISAMLSNNMVFKNTCYYYKGGEYCKTSIEYEKSLEGENQPQKSGLVKMACTVSFSSEILELLFS